LNAPLELSVCVIGNVPFVHCAFRVATPPLATVCDAGVSEQPEGADPPPAVHDSAMFAVAFPRPPKTSAWYTQLLTAVAAPLIAICAHPALAAAGQFPEFWPLAVQYH
jgi:hypothetical protein